MWSETASPVRYYNIKRPPLYKTRRRSQPRSPPICSASSAAARGAASALGAVYCTFGAVAARTWSASGRVGKLGTENKRRSRSRSEDVVAEGTHSATRRSLATIEGSTTRRSHATTTCTSTIGGSSTTGRSLATTGGSTTKHHWEVWSPANPGGREPSLVRMPLVGQIGPRRRRQDRCAQEFGFRA